MAEVKLYQKLSRFPLGALRAGGFLEEQLTRCKHGMGGMLDILEPGMIADPYINKSYVPQWGDGDQSGWGAEISGNYWTGLIELAFTLGDAELIKKATDWVDGMLKHQKADGYLGTYYEDDAKIYEDYNGWGTACAMRGLLAFYEATGRKDVLDAVCGCMLWFVDKWAGDNKTTYAAHLLIEIMIFCYKHTGNKKFVDFCVEYEEYLVTHDIFSQSYKAFLNNDFQFNSHHTAGMGVSIRLPALIYAATGRREYLEASERIISFIQKKAVQLSGSPVSVTEYLGPVSSINETEYCSYAFYNASYSYLGCITGKAKYGDYMESMFYNGAQGARKKDERAIAYLSAPNQIYATDDSSSAMSDMQAYAPCYPVSCCPVNAVAVLPEFVRGMLLRDGEGDIYATVYGPCSLDYEGLQIEEKTLYPFRNKVEFVIKKLPPQGMKRLYLKIPGWSEGYSLLLNGKEINKVGDAVDGYIKLENDFSENDIVTVEFKASVKVIRVDDSDASKKYPIAFKYGALLFSLCLKADWIAVKGRPATPLPEGWSWYSVLPMYEEPDAKDMHEVIGLRRHKYPWNVAVDENISPDSITVKLREDGGYVWENPPIELEAEAYKAPFLTSPYPHRTFEPFEDRQKVTDKIPLTLVPYGCTNLRITYFARAGLQK